MSQLAGKGTERNQTGCFLYDALNRMVVSGALDAQVTVGEQTLRHVYDSTSINGVLAFTTSYAVAGCLVADAVASKNAPAIKSGMALPVESTRSPELPYCPCCSVPQTCGATCASCLWQKFPTPSA